MKLNVDVGEGAGNDEALFRWIDMANIACGYHAGDTETMSKTVDLAVTYGVVIGAHPGYRDREGFGRRSIAHSPGEIEQLVIDQYEALRAVCEQYGTTPQYIKPHGALYHDMMHRPDVYEEILQALAGMDQTPLMIMARADDQRDRLLAQKYGVSLLFEAFADRVYTDQGDLQDRSEKGAVITSTQKMLEQARQIKNHGTVTTVSGKILPMNADVLCIHGDNASAVDAVKELYQALRS